MRNSSLLQSYPTELGNIMNHVINGMVYLHECRVVHGELVPKNCLVGDKGIIKISGFHCARSPWCKRPLSDEVYNNKVPIPAPEASQSIGTYSSDVWAYGLFIYFVATVGQQPITDLQQVLSYKPAEDTLDQVGSFVEKISACLQTEPTDRPTFQDLSDQVSEKVGSSTPSCSSHSFEGSLNAQTLTEEVPTVKSTSRKNKESTVECFVDDNGTMAWDNTDVALSYSQDELRQRLKNAELEALKAKALQKRAEAAKDAILSQVQEAETKCLKEVELMTKTFLMRLNEANDRAAEAEQARYLAEEVKRLTEEKYTLYKYESEKNMHELKSMFDDALLERDELITALKTVGKDFDAPELISPRRRDSIHQLEEKYQRYISTSDRTIQSLKTQLNGVVKHRDQLAIDREAARNEMKDTREALEQAVKEKEEFQFRLEEAQFEIERLEEMISTMTQKRQQAERERDQLQMLTDMSLMKLRQAESEAPKKRVSLCSFPTKNDERPTENREPSLRRLSEQLLHLIGPSPMEVQSKSDENYMEEGSENATSDDGAVSSDGQLEQEHPSKSSREVALRRPGKTAMPSVPQVKEFRRATPTRRRENYSNENIWWDAGDPLAPHKFAHINYHQTKDDEKQSEYAQWHDSPIKKHEPETSIHHEEESKEKIAHSIEQHRKDSLKQFTIPTLHIEEADTDLEMDHQRGVPDIEISEFDENDLIAEEDEEEEEVFHGSENNQDSPMFIIGDQEGHTRIVYSFDDLPELLQGIPQTNL